ncbi:hypothetical protein LCGC14_2042780, partial [marine sediment metagenome]
MDKKLIAKTYLAYPQWDFGPNWRGITGSETVDAYRAL